MYKDNIYWCSLIVEVKYRTIRNFWEYDSVSKEQIMAYKNEYKSKFCRGFSNEEFVVRKINPIDIVWVFNPTHNEEKIIEKRNEGIKLVQLIPGDNHENIINELKKEINMAFEEELL